VPRFGKGLGFVFKCIQKDPDMALICFLENRTEKQNEWAGGSPPVGKKKKVRKRKGRRKAVPGERAKLVGNRRPKTTLGASERNAPI